MNPKIMIGSSAPAVPDFRRRGVFRKGGAALAALVAVAPLFLWSGCTALTKVTPAAPPAVAARPAGTAPAPSAVPPEVPSPSPQPASPPVVAPGPSLVEALPVAGQVNMLVESAPAGATIVMDGRPLGKAPLRISVPATSLGFFRDYVEVRARFIAENASEISHTATEEFSPREKVPAILHFTPDGAQRTVR
jgi:PEGA domain